MSSASEIRSRTNIHAGHLLIASLIIGLVLALIFGLPAFQRLRIPFLYVLPATLLYCTVLAFIIARNGQHKSRTIPLLVGVVLISGGTIFDMLATVIKSPDLNLEGNVFARLLLDSNHSLTFVYVYAIITQFLLTLLLCILWAAFLRHQQTLLTVTWESNPKSRSEFIKAALGGEGYSWSVFFSFPKLSSPYYKRVMYHSLLFLACILPPISLYRWWLGAEWFNFVPNLTDSTIAISFMVLGIILYLAWLLREYANGTKNVS